MKKLVRVSLFVLMAVMLVSFAGCKNDADPEPAPVTPEASKFVGTWKSTDGTTTVTVTSATFTTEVTGMPEPFSGTYTVSPDGKTLTTSEITLPEEMGGTKVAFSMKLKDSETDVMDLPLSEIGMEDLVLVKTSSTKSDLTGTWEGKVVSAGNADATIVFTADNKATLTVGEGSAVSTNVDQNGNFFTITWDGSNPLGLSESTGLISVSGKAWLDDGSVFTKQQ